MTHFRWEEKGYSGREPAQSVYAEGRVGESEPLGNCPEVLSQWAAGMWRKLDSRLHPMEYRSYMHRYMGNHRSQRVHLAQVTERDDGIPNHRLDDGRSTECCIAPACGAVKNRSGKVQHAMPLWPYETRGVWLASGCGWRRPQRLQPAGR